MNTYTAMRLFDTDVILHCLSDLWTEEHIFDALDSSVKTFYGAHRLFSAIERNEVRVYAAFAGEFCGVTFGRLTDDRKSFEIHIAIRRGFDGAKCGLACEQEIVADYKKEGVDVESIVGFIPEFNRAALIASRRYGCVDMGLRKDILFDHGGVLCPCKEMRKTLR